MIVRCLIVCMLLCCALLPAAAQVSTFQLSLKDSNANILFAGVPNFVRLTGLQPKDVIRIGPTQIAVTDNIAVVCPPKAGKDTLVVLRKKKRVYSKEFIVDQTPEIKVRLGLLTDSLATIREVIANGKLWLDAGDAPYLVPAGIVGFDVLIKTRKLYYLPVHVTGDLLRLDEIKVISRMQPGEKIVFDNISAWGGNVCPRSFGRFVVTIK